MTFRKLTVLLIIKIISMLTGLAFVRNKYSLQINTSTKIDSPYLIEKYKVNNKIMCLVQCNLIENCFSVAYNQNSIANCFLYSKYFSSNELTPLKNSLFYSKECKAKNFNFISKYRNQSFTIAAIVSGINLVLHAKLSKMFYKKAK